MSLENGLEKKTSETLSLWEEEGRRLIPQNYEEFRGLVAQAKNFMNCRKYNMAAIYSEMAALYAVSNHCGLFVSLELEQILLEIGRESIHSSFELRKPKPWSGSHMRILHVASSVMSIGGLSKMLWRWIQQDAKNFHSLALTRQSPNHKVPKILKDAVLNSNGKIHLLGESIGNLISWARQLRKIAANADLVILHIYNYDVIPIIAFANKQQSPPILFLDHADHMFWLGTSVSDVVINLRQSGMQLARERRSVEARRNILLPIILEPVQRSLSRAEAKRKIGIPESSILLFSVARAIKYKTINKVSFADAHVPLLKQYEQAILIVIGPSNCKDWAIAIQQTKGRIKFLEETDKTAVYYQAADIYVDSYPFGSNTSLLEAGSYGLPLISRYPYPSDACKIFGAGMPGLTENLIEVRSLKEYTEVLSRLIENENFRICLGEATQKKIIEIHTGSYWKKLLQDVYNLAINLPKVSESIPPINRIVVDEPDVYLQSIHGWNVNFDSYIQHMPLIQRLSHWSQIYKKYNLQKQIMLLIPAWIGMHYARLKATLKNTLK